MKINIKKKLKSAGSTIKGMGSIDKKSLKNGSYSMGITAIVIAVLVVINLIVGQIPEKYTQVDVSTQKLYTISDTTVKYLKDMNTDVTIYHIVQSGKEDSVLEKMLTRYEEESKHIKVEKKDPVLYPNFTSQYTSDDVADNSLIVVAGEKSKVISYSDLYETEMDYTTYQTNTTGFDGEGQIDSAISYVTSENLPVIYTLEGHEELELNSSLTDSLQKANYDVQSLNLLTQDAVSEDTGCLLIAAPQKDLSEEETQKIITYMEAGGKVMIFTEYTGTDMPNLKSVLENYGVTTGDGVIMEGDTGHYIMQRPYYIVPTIDSSDITSDIKSNNRYVLAPISQPVKTLSDYRDTLQISSLLSTSDEAYIKTDVQNMTTYEKEDSDEEGSFQVGVSVTEQVDDDNTTQLVCFGCASLLDEATDQQVSGGNTDLVLAALGWMCENDAPVIDVTSKSLTMSYLTVPQFDAAYWSIIVCGVIPVVFLLIGTVIWFKRRKQ
jgi:ABC-2 type transport system permease protein